MIGTCPEPRPDDPEYFKKITEYCGKCSSLSPGSTACSPVCADNTNYKNIYCARCNKANSYSTGKCDDAKPIRTLISSCWGEGDVSRYERYCLAGREEPVCANGEDYKNKGWSVPPSA